jgi:hypothetical protein
VRNEPAFCISPGGEEKGLDDDIERWRRGHMAALEVQYDAQGSMMTGGESGGSLMPTTTADVSSSRTAAMNRALARGR